MVMINIQFFRYNGEPNTLNKELGTPFVLIGTFYNQVDVTRPILTVRGFDVQEYNYCYIEELNRYYFISNLILEDNQDTRIYLDIDVLKTYQSEITQATATVVESSTADRFISTRSNTYDKRPKFEVLSFNESLFKEDGQIIMITLKGSDNG